MGKDCDTELTKGRVICAMFFLGLGVGESCQILEKKDGC